MLFIYWLPLSLISTLCMLPAVSVAGMLSSSAPSAPAGSLQGDLE
jgi:hypothetical protein